MSKEVEDKYREVLDKLGPVFGDGMELMDVLFLVGIRESGKAPTKMSKQEKEDAMHLGTCTILEQYGYYKSLGEDEEGWPQFEHLKDLPPMNEQEQEALLKKGVADYFEKV
jgi:hypothetical protein